MRIKILLKKINRKAIVVEFKKVKRMLWLALMTVVGFYLTVLALLFFAQEQFVYFPTMDIDGTPKEVGVDYREVQLITRDQITLWAWWIEVPYARNTVLICHGNAGNITHRLGKIEVFSKKLHCNTLIFDYRGYGRSKGSPSEHGTYRDVAAAWQFLITQGIPQEKIIVMGRSLGGPIAAYIASQHKPAALILESTFTSLPDLAQEVYPYFPSRFLTRIGYPTKKYLAQVKCPVLIVHSKDDDVIPFHHGQELFESAPEPKEFLEIKGNHNDGYLVSEEVYIPKLEKFLAKYAAK